MALQVISINYSNIPGTAIVAFFRIPLAVLSAWVAVFPNNLALYLENLKLSPLALSD